ncbi:MAG: hypothetical protein HRT53_01855 [Colwellia sp.]|nr:hypothetical protein [Colwellia sp.]
MGVKLNFINNSNDSNNSQIVVFQKNVTTDFDELSIAWKVIKYCGQGDNHPFYYPMGMKVSASDSHGNFTAQLPAQNGQMFAMSLSASGNTLDESGASTSMKEVQVRNDLKAGAINASIYKDGKLLAQKTSVAPEQKGVFQFKPTIWIGVASQIEEGEVMNSAIISDINTEISLLGIASADIIMTGGGSGTGSKKFSFTLDNVRRV